MGRQVYLSDQDLKTLEMLEKLFDADSGNSGAYSEEDEAVTSKFFDKVFDR